jgi:copper homeostasis protein
MITPSRPLLEVIACTVDDAVAAEQGSADRIELVRDLARGGLTPDVAVVAAVLEAVRIPVRVMIREEEPFVVSDPGVARALCDAARAISQLRVEGLVLGVLDSAGGLDEPLLGRMLRDTRGVAVTFHRAFEDVADQAAGFAAMRRWPQIDRVLVNGGSGTAAQRVAVLRRLGSLAGDGIRVLSAVGSDRDLLAAVCAAPELGEAHVGRAARDPETVDAPVSAAKVAELAAIRDAVRRDSHSQY